MADVGVFSRYKGFADFQEEAEKQGLAAALTQAKLSNVGSSGNLPAPIQVANEMFRYKQLATDPTQDEETRQIASDRYNLLGQAAKTYGFAPGVYTGVDGASGNVPGFAPAVGAIEAAKAGAKEQATSNVKVVMDPLIEGRKSDASNASDIRAAAPKAQKTEIGKAQGVAQGGLFSKAMNANNGLSAIEAITFKDESGKDLLDKATGSDLGAVGARLNKFVGKSTDATQANAKLKVLSDSLLKSVPRFEGPQSNIDVQSYKDAAGAIGDPTIPGEDRRAALNIIQTLNNKYVADVSSIDDVLSNYQGRPATPAAAREQFNAKKAAASGIKEGTTATNPATGQKITFRNGQWQ